MASECRTWRLRRQAYLHPYHDSTLVTPAPLPPCRTDMGGKKEDVCEVEIQGVW